MNIFKKPGFEKGDERGIYIASKALRNSWIFNSTALFLWMIVELLRNGPTSVFYILLIIFSSGLTVFWSFYIYYLKKTSG
ncbi:MAG: hypothetical protein K8S14_01050 [Actinomycetia bacterium]|nr:hypothetical protein [Actinomycetes bacterium]